MIIDIKAKFSCDRCGREFTLKIDPVDNIPADWSMFDKAVDAIRGSYGYEDGEGSYGRYASTDGERHYCHPCTDKIERRAAK